MLSSMSDFLSQLGNVASEIPKSFAIRDSGASPLRATATTSRRNSPGYGLGMIDWVPELLNHEPHMTIGTQFGVSLLG